MHDILKLLENDATLSAAQIASMLGRATEDVAADIKKCEAEKIIIGRKAVIDWEKVGEEKVTALIEVKTVPQRGEGFDRIAERIYQYDEVESLYLMSGAFDLTVIIRGASMKEVASFVSECLSTIDGVTGTATHFILKKYKENNTIFPALPEQEERIMFV